MLTYMRSGLDLLLKPKKKSIRPIHVILEHTTHCPFNCIMCPRKDEVSKANHMSFEKFKAIIDAIKPKKLYLAPNGESLVHPQFCDLVRYAKENGAHVSVVTSFAALAKGLTLSDLIESGLDLMKISIDASTPETYRTVRGTRLFDEVIDRVQQLNAMKAKMHSKTPYTRFQFVVLKDNYFEAEPVVQLAHDIGIDAVFYKPLEISRIEDRKDNFLSGLNYDDFVEPLKEAYKLSQKLGVKTNLHDLLTNMLPQYWRFYTADPTFKGFPKKCLIPWFSVRVKINGDVILCCYCHFDDGYMGNIFEDGFDKIWNSKRYQTARNKLKHDKPAIEKCKTCIPQSFTHLINYSRVNPGYRSIRNKTH